MEGNHNYTAEQILRWPAFAWARLPANPNSKPRATSWWPPVRSTTSAIGIAPAKDGKGYDATFEVAEIGQMYPVRFEDLPASDAQLRAWLKQKDPLFGDKDSGHQTGSRSLRCVDLRISG